MTLESLRKISHTVEEASTANKVIKVFGGQSKLSERFFQASEQLRRSMMREAVPSSAITPITHIAASLAVAFIIYLALGQPTGQAGASAGGFISFITALLMVISPVKQLTTINTTLQLRRAALRARMLAEAEEEDGAAGGGGQYQYFNDNIVVKCTK